MRARQWLGLLALAFAGMLAATPAHADDPRITALAASLGNNPAQIFAYMRDQVGIDLYSGSLRGPLGTLASKAGSPIDRTALAVALLRAAGYTARYAQGTLSSTDALRAVARMFPGVQRALGCYNPGGVFDPANDYQLNQYARAHTWAEYRPTSAAAFAAFDPTFADATIGTAPAAASTTFDEIPDAQKQKVRFRVVVEMYSQAGGVFGFPIGTSTVLDRTYNAADLVDKPVSFGHFVSQTTLPGLAISASTNTYSPYLVVGDSTLDPRDYDVVRGTDYTELLTNFPLGSNVVTGVFVNVDIIDPAAPASPQSTQRTIVDRIGYAKRQTGGSISVSPAPDNGPALTPMDLVTIQVAPSKQPLDSFAARRARLAGMQAEVAAIAPLVAALPPPASMTADDAALASRATALNRAVAMTLMEVSTTVFAGAADVAMDKTAAMYLVRPVIATPRLTVARALLDNNALSFSLDIRRNTLATYSLPGISFRNTGHFERARGLTESALEGTILGQLTGQPVATIASLFAAQANPSAYLPLTPANMADVDNLALSADAKARIKDALYANRVVIAPRAPVTVNGSPLTAWLESDPATGATISTFEDGTHGALVEYTAIYLNKFGTDTLEASMARLAGNINSFSLVSLAYMAGLLDAVSANATLEQSWKTTKATIKDILDKTLAPVIDFIDQTRIDLQGPYGQIKAYLDGLSEGLTNFKHQLDVALGDPPVPTILIAPLNPPLPAATAPGVTAGVTVTLTPDPRWVLPYNGGELGTVFLAHVRNTGPATDTFYLQGTGSDYPFFEPNTNAVLTLAPGAAGELSACLIPYAAPGTAGTPVNVGVIVKSTTDPTVSGTATSSFATPAVKAAALRIMPANVNVQAGQSTAATLTVDSLGNTATTLALAADLAPGLTLSGLPASVTLAAGTSQSLPLTFSVGAAVPTGATLSALVTGDFGGVDSPVAAFAASVVSATTQCTVRSGSSASDLARYSLGGSLYRLAGAMDALRAAPADSVLRQAVLVELDYLVNIQFTGGDQAYLNPYAASLGALRAALAGAGSGQVAAVLTQIDTALCGLDQTLVKAIQRNYALTLAPNVATNIPSQPTTVNINIYNQLAIPRVFDVAISGVPANVTAIINAPTITVPANNVTNGFAAPALAVTFTNTDGQARAFEYVVTATPHDQPLATDSVDGQLALRPDLVRVVQVSTTPAYGPVGTVFAVTVHAMNSINTPQSIYATWEVRDQHNVVRKNGQTAAVAVTSGDGLFDLAPFNVDTTGFAEDIFTIDVTLRTSLPACCDPVPGGTGQGAFIVGVPFSALLSVAPQSVPPGNSTVALALELSHDTLATPAITVKGSLPLAAEARSLALAGNYLYACQADRVSIFDATNPQAPVFLSSFATDVLAAGYGSVACNLAGGTLVLAYSGDSPTSFDTVKVVVYDISGVHATSPVQQNAVPADLGKLFGGTILFNGTTGYMTTQVFIYNPFSNFIDQQYGNLLALDFSTPTLPTLTGELFHHFPSPPSTDSNHPTFGGPTMVYGAARSGNYLYVPTTTSMGGDVAGGVARLDVVQASLLPTDCAGDPNPCIIKTVDVPEAHRFFGIAQQGTTLIAAGDTYGYYDALSGLNGNLTITAFDTTSPANPVVRSTLVTALRNNRTANQCVAGPGDAGGATVTALDNQFYAVGGFNPLTCSWVMTLVDASDPDHLRVIPYDVTDVLATTVLAGNTLYAVTRTGILVYDYAILTGPAITASVDMAKGNGVSVIAGSFNLAPTSVDTSAAGFDRYTWVQPTLATITWQASVTGMDPGETRDVALAGLVEFTLPSIGSGELPIDGVVVVSDQLLSIAPVEQTVGIARPATYTVSLHNPTAAAVTYALTLDGIDPTWLLSIDSPVTVPANGDATAQLVLQSALGDYGGAYRLRVNATAPGWTGMANAILDINGYDRPTGGDPIQQAFGTAVVAVPEPVKVGRADTARVTLHTTNVGTGAVQYQYVAADVPNNWLVTFENNNVLTQADGVLDVIANIATPVGVAPGDYTVGVDLYGGFALIGRTTLHVTVVAAGVRVALAPPSGTPSTPFAVTVTNTGTATDTFDLTALGLLGPVVSYDVAAVTLAAGAAQVVTATLGDVGYLPPGGSTFDVVAVSRSDAAASYRATAQVTLSAAKGVALGGVPVIAILPSAPGAASFAVELQNAGNVEDTYALAITATSANVSANLRSSANQSAQSLAPLTLPGQALGLFALNATLNSGAAGTVTLVARSQTDGTIVASLTLTLQVAAAASVTAAPNPLAFGMQTVGVASSAATSVFTNGGSAAFTLTTLGVAGAQAADYAIGSGANACSAGTVLAAGGGACTLYVTFTPGAPGARAATVTATDGGTGSSATVALTGTGIAANTCYSGSVPGGTATACFTGGSASCQYAHAAFIALDGDPASPPAGSAPAGYVFPFGLFDFATTGCSTGGTLTFTIDYPRALPSGTVYYKYGSPDGIAPPQWYVLPATVSGSRAVFTLPSGNITDPGGPAYVAAVPPPATRVIPVPALHTALLALLAWLLASLGAAAVRRR